MLPNPLIHILQVFRKHEVRFLLMGGQACILYGASEFTRDTDFCVFCDAKNLSKIQLALDELCAEQIFYPSLDREFLMKGHACHFLCGVEEARGFRIDIMSRMRNCPDFIEMWAEHCLMQIDEALEVPVLGLRHLVSAKKTQRDKDWPMVRRLIEADYQKNPVPDEDKVLFWLNECRTPAILFELNELYPSLFRSVHRTVLDTVPGRNEKNLEQALVEEEFLEREKDREYWAPLKMELEAMRHGR